MKKLLAICLVLGCSAVAYGDPPSDAGTVIVPAMVDAGAAPVVTPADALPNPLERPAQAMDDAKLARKTSWPLAVWAALAMAGKALAYGRDKMQGMPVFDDLATWLSKGKHAMWVAAVGAVGAAGYNVMVSGGTLVAALLASGIAIAGLSHSTTKGAAPSV